MAVRNRGRGVAEHDSSGDHPRCAETTERKKEKQRAREERDDSERLARDIDVEVEPNGSGQHRRQKHARVALDRVLADVPRQLTVPGEVLGVAIGDVRIVDRPLRKDDQRRGGVQQARHDDGRDEAESETGSVTRW